MYGIYQKLNVPQNWSSTGYIICSKCSQSKRLTAMESCKYHPSERFSCLVALKCKVWDCKGQTAWREVRYAPVGGCTSDPGNPELWCVWEKDAITDPRVRSISLKVSSFPYVASNSFHFSQNSLSVAGLARLLAWDKMALALSTSPTSVSSLAYLQNCVKL